jgi:membrane fusion protein, multidrug efflux system
MQRRTKTIAGALAVLVVLGLGYLAWREYGPAAQGAPKQAASARSGGPGGGPVPVVAVPAATGAMDIIVNGLGTATPLRTVTVRTRVDGELVRVLFQEGELVKQGQLLAQVDPRSFQVALSQAEGQLARDRALLENARVDLERYKTLFAQDSIAKQQVDTQASLVRQYEAAIQMDKSQVDNARLQLSYTKITAPIGGRVGLRLVDAGNIVRSGDQNGLVVITQLEPITVLFSVPQDTVPAVMRRMQGGERIPVEAWDREQRAKLAAGALASVDNQVDPTTGTVKLKAQFANDDRALFPNQFVNVRMKLDTLNDAIVVPAAAVQRGAQGLFIYVVRPDNTVAQRPVKLGPSEPQRVAIAEGLALGEMVVTDGMDRLRPGAAVQTAAQRPEVKVPTADKGSRRRQKDGG